MSDPNFETIHVSGEVWLMRRWEAWYPMRKTSEGNLAFLHTAEDKHDGTEASARHIAHAWLVANAPKSPELDTFTLAYVEAALWSTSAEIGECGECGHVGVTDHNDRCAKCEGEVSGKDLSMQDRGMGLADIADETLTRMAEDCRKFQAEMIEEIAWDNLVRFPHRYSTQEKAGHDFWLTRCGHGAGFWDGDWEEEAGKRLTEACKRFGEVELYVGDDGRIYS